MIARLVLTLEEAWYRGAPWLLLLVPLEWCFRGAVFLRRYAFRRGLRRSYHAPVPVVVVGNITLGGTGKTEVVIALVQALAERGIRAGVVSRGYGGSGSPQPRQVNASSLVEDVGDEAVMIFARTGCPVVVAGSRALAVRFLLATAEVDVVLSDDGLQHYTLARDLEVALYDATSAFGNGHCLPAGPLREPLSRLSRVDFVLSRGGEGSGADIIYRPLELSNLASGDTVAFSPEEVGDRVYGVAALGRPGQFIASLEGAGFSVEPRLYADHYPFSSRDFAGLDDRAVIMTEKDAVKCARLAGSNAWSLRVKAHLPAALVEAVASLAPSSE
mgnify:CR=1 FL=1